MRFTAMNRRISLSVLPRVIAGLVVLFGVAASPAVASHHHHVASHHRRTQGGTSAVGSDPKGKSGTKETDTKEGRKDDGKGNTAEGTPPEQQGNTKPETNGKGEARDDRGAKSIGAEGNPIDTSNTITGPAPFARAAKRKSTVIPKSWPHRLKTVSKGTTKHSFVRNAIGERVELKHGAVDPKEHGSNNGDPPTVNGIHESTNPPTAGATGGAVPNLQPKPVPLIWRLGRPHDPSPNMAAYRAGLTGLNGLGVVRVGAGTGSIGGGANLNTGVLNGSSFHPKPR
jgi:hypothetical protein